MCTKGAPVPVKKQTLPFHYTPVFSIEKIFSLYLYKVSMFIII